MTETHCALCDLPCTGADPIRRRFEDADRRFCCLGCMNVYAILQESGVLASGVNIRDTEVFKRSLELGLISTPQSREPEPSTKDEGTEGAEALVHVSGMWCASCAWLIEHVLRKEPGVLRADAFFASDLVKVRYKPQYIPPDRILRRISDLGYSASEYAAENSKADTERRDLLLRTGVAGFLWLNIMMLSLGLYAGYFQEISDGARQIIPLILMALATPVLLYSARPIFQLAWTGLKHGSIRMETLLSLGILAAYVYSSVQAFRGTIHVYFDTASAIVTLVLAGKMMEKGAREKTAQSISFLYRMMPLKARLMLDGRERYISVDALKPGDTFVVKAGEKIPADGLVIAGHSHADESLLTGESRPIVKEPGCPVISGSTNQDDVLRVQTTRVGKDTILAQVIHHVEQALSNRSRLERAVDRVSRVFVPSVIVVAVATFLVCTLLQITTIGEALLRAITVLVIACPCALGLATPLAITAAVGAASRKGILVSNSQVLETIRTVDTLVLDKTGTVTEGKFSLLDYELAQQSLIVAEPAVPRLIADHEAFVNGCLPLLASLEKYSEHPLGRAVIGRAESEGCTLIEATDVSIHKGRGIAGTVAGRRVFIGNRQMVLEETGTVNHELEQSATDRQETGNTVAYFGFDGVARGLLVFGDRIKQEAASVVATLQARSVRVLLVSGDAEATTRSVAGLIGADDHIAEALPAEKTASVRRLQDQGRVVAMLGDGVNDAPALAQANLGIAMGSGADIAMKAAAIVLMGPSLHRIVEAFDLAQKTWRVVRQNLFWAFFFNTAGISLAATGVLNPIIAAGAMLLSSFAVLFNSRRISRR